MYGNYKYGTLVRNFGMKYLYGYLFRFVYGKYGVVG